MQEIAPLPYNFNRPNEIQAIDTAVNDFIVILNNPKFRPDVVSGGYLFTKTLMQNMIILLAGPADMIDDQRVHRYIKNAYDMQFANGMLAIMTHFFVSICIQTEAALSEIFSKHNIVVRHKREGYHPVAESYVDALLKQGMLDPLVGKKWKEYFDILYKFRNKCSHSNTQFDKAQIELIKKTPFSILLSDDGYPTFKVSFLPQICEHIILFFDEIGIR